VAAVILWNYL